MANPKAGSRHVYQHMVGLGELHNPDISAEMADLDLKPGTPVKVVGHDEDRNLVLLEWTDAQGNPRITSVEPDVFTAHFEKG
jgi:hypothetical protein